MCVYVLAGGLWIHHVTLENQLDLIFSPKETKLLFVSRAFRFGVSVIFGRSVGRFWIAKTAENGICIGEALKVPKGPAIGHP
jgi:hypothetical protein